MLVGVYEFVLDSYAGQSSTTKSLNVQLISAEILTPDATGNVRSGCSGTFQLGPGSELKLPMSSLPPPIPITNTPGGGAFGPAFDFGVGRGGVVGQAGVGGGGGGGDFG